MADPCPPPPALGAGIDAWREWVDAALPYRATTFTGPAELRVITKIRDRGIAAVTAEQWFREQARDKPKRRRSEQQSFDGEDWSR